jgi:hypothetical protein
MYPPPSTTRDVESYYGEANSIFTSHFHAEVKRIYAAYLVICNMFYYFTESIQLEAYTTSGQKKTDKSTNSDLQNRSWWRQYRIVTLTII